MKKMLIFFIIFFSNLVFAANIDIEYETIKGDLLLGEQPIYILHFQNKEDISYMISLKSIDLNWILKQEGELYLLEKETLLDIPISYEQLGEIQRKEQGINLIIEVGDNRYEKILPVNPIDYSKIVKLEFFSLPTLDPKKTTNIGIKVINPYDVDLKDVKLTIENKDLFKLEQTFDLSKKEEKLVEFPIIIEPKTLEGSYPAMIFVNYNNEIQISQDFSISIQEYQDLKNKPNTEKSFLKTVKTIEYINNGNNILNEKHVETLSYIASKFTKFEPAPNQYENGIATWNIELKPGDLFNIQYTTSYRLSLLILIILILLAYSIYYFTYKPIRFSKAIISLKGGQDHYKKLKVKLKIKNISNKNLDDITISDKIPGTTKIPYIEKGPHPRHTGIGTNSITLSWALQLRKGEATTIIYNIDENINISKARLIFSPARAKCTYKNRQYSTKS
ncbi:MAG TPA: hypothetical protein VJB89_00425 [Candidatus Nanoarchaeia archaeon]|nr:hypothetical protein [Candidatus Nanoarchaeia archaeon]